MRQKNDGIIEAVRYAADGLISQVRIYERRGQVWSDRVLVDRSQVVELLRSGKRLVTGARKPNHGNTFEIANPVKLVDGNILSEGKPAGRDHIAGISLF